MCVKAKALMGAESRDRLGKHLCSVVKARTYRLGFNLVTNVPKTRYSLFD